VSRDQIIAAIESNLPFGIRMADGREYLVPHKDYISLPPKGAFVIVYGYQGGAYMLPLLMITGLIAKADQPNAEP
jgi:hypothetical protein